MKQMPEAAPDSIPTRQSLLARMKDWDDHQSWQDFFNTYWRLIYGVALKFGLTPAEGEEVVQETIIAVAKGIADFKNDRARGSFKSWLMLITRRRIVDQFRKRPRLEQLAQQTAEGTTRTSPLDRIADPASLDVDAIWEQQWEKNLWSVALENVKRGTSPKQFLLFHETVIKDCAGARVAEKYGVNLAQVYMAKYRVARLLKKEVRRLQRGAP